MTLRFGLYAELQAPPHKPHAELYRELLAQTPVDELQVREHPSVVFRVNPNTWIEATVRYLVEPREAYLKAVDKEDLLNRFRSLDVDLASVVPSERPLEVAA